MYCAPPSMAACCSSCSLVRPSRIGSRLRSSVRRCSSAARSLALSSSYWLRAAASACSRCRRSASAVCRPACAAASFRPASSSSICAAACTLVATCCCAVSIERCSSAWRADSVRDWKRRLLRLALQRAQLLARVVQRRSASMTASSSSAVALLRIGQLQVQLLEARLAQAAALGAARRAARPARPVHRRAGCGAAWLASACCVRRSSSTCVWWARVCASAASRRAVARRSEASV